MKIQMTQQDRISRKPLVCICLALIFLLGCQVTPTKSYVAKTTKELYAKPTVGVMAFSNYAHGQMPANLGHQLAEQLAEELIQTERFIILTPQQTHGVLAQNTSRFRKKQAAQFLPSTANQISYLIRGKITDYGYVELDNWKDRVGELKMFSRGYAIVGVTLSLIDTHTGHTLAVKRLSGKVNCSKEELDKVKHNEKASFASNAYFYTTMGKATNKFLKYAVKEVGHLVKNPPYQPKIASMINDRVVINGGNDRGIQMYSQFIVRPPSNVVIDPDSNVQLGFITGQRIGKVQVTQVLEHYSIAKILEGHNMIKPHQTLFPVEVYDKVDRSHKAVLSNY